MRVHLGEEPLPLGTRMSVIQQEVRAVFVGLAQALACPVVVRDNLTQWDVVFIHQVSCELGGALDGRRPTVPPVFTHLNTDRVTVAGAIEVGVFTLFVCGKVLDGSVLIRRVVPDEVADTITPFAFVGTEFTVFKSHGVAQGIGTAGIVLRAVDGDVSGLHWPPILPCVGTAPYKILFHIHLTVERSCSL